MWRNWGAASALSVSLAAAGCGRPATDIVATTTEDVGPYEFTSSATDGELTGRACVAGSHSADVIADRIRDQVANHGFRSITIDVYSPGRRPQSSIALGRYVWAGAEHSRLAAPANPNACDAQPGRDSH
jgi:hypothetical protein